MTTPYNQTDHYHAELKLPCGLLVKVDNDLYEELSKLPWISCQRGKNTYVIRYFQENKISRHEYMHRRVLGAIQGQIVDHINRDGLDNTRGNLRFVSKSINAINRDGATGVRATSSNRKKKYWAYITIDGKQTSLGYYKTFDEARKVRLNKQNEVCK